MVIIAELVKDINCFIDKAECYIDKAIEWKDEYAEISEEYFKIYEVWKFTHSEILNRIDHIQYKVDKYKAM